MELKLVVAIIRPLASESVQKNRQEMGVRGLTVIGAKGYGAYADVFTREWLVDQVKTPAPTRISTVQRRFV